VDLETFADGLYADALRSAASALDLDPESLRGNVSVPWINSRLPELTGGDIPDAIAESEELPRGYAYHQLLKTSQFSRVGSRYVLAEAPFSALARSRYVESDGAEQQLMGATQRAWFLDTMARARGTFKVWANEVAFMARRLDLSAASLLPEELRTRIIISAEDWDGFPDEREALLVELAKLENVVILSGDLHCFLAGTPFSSADSQMRVVELLTSSVTSTTWREAIAEVLATDPSIPPGAAAVASSVGALLQDAATKPNPHLAFQDLGRNGCSVVSVQANAMTVEFRALDPKDVRQAPALLSGDLAARFKTERFRIPADNYGLEREIDGRFVPWDAQAAAWQEP
jgi:alkaline phosphatase D